ncbi:MAG TPA: helix-hairpin-helix domain-containing protein [Pirellulales bacterium]|jgi:DNA polymerase (family 10)|nr:helix-hairpin-helix domain-containing protein [Pirellulales bacterium]
MRRKIAPAPVTNAQIADSLDEIAHLLELQLANPFRLSAYRRAADQIRNWPLSVAELYRSGGLAALEELPGIGTSLAKKIAELVKRGRLRFLDRLRRKASSADALLNLPTVGPVLANRIRGKLGASNLEEVFRAAQDGRLRRVDGIGDKRVRAIRDSLSRRLPSLSRVDRVEPPTGVSVSELLAIDQEYRGKAERDRLPRVAPHRFNPTGAAWLPILQTERRGRRFRAHFTNTARCHALGGLYDWVTIVCESKPQYGEWTIATARSGPLSGKRIVKGRELECVDSYSNRKVQLSVLESDSISS